jgi:hypothetical protein
MLDVLSGQQLVRFSEVCHLSQGIEKGRRESSWEQTNAGIELINGVLDHLKIRSRILTDNKGTSITWKHLFFSLPTHNRRMDHKTFNLFTLLGSFAIQTVIASCNADNYLRALSNSPLSASSFCHTFTVAPAMSIPALASACSSAASRIFSACSCVVGPSGSTTLLSQTTTSGSTTDKQLL